MAGENFELKPAEQCTKTEQGHFGETMKDVFQGHSGLLAREEIWTRDQWSALRQELDGRSGRDEQRDPGPYNKTFLDIALSSDIYSLGKDTQTLSVDGKAVEKTSAQYTDGMAKMEEAAKKINFDAPACGSGAVMGLWENLDQKR